MPTSLQGIAQKAEADLRKRVFLKSPVRENRTPGSVRGRSGNWPSYRDDVKVMKEKTARKSRWQSVDSSLQWSLLQQFGHVVA